MPIFIRVKKGPNGLRPDKKSTVQLKIVLLKTPEWYEEWIEDNPNSRQDIDLKKIISVTIVSINTFLKEYGATIDTLCYANVHGDRDADVLCIIMGLKISQPKIFSIVESRLLIVKAISELGFTVVYLSIGDNFTNSPSWEAIVMGSEPIVSYENNEITKFMKDNKKSRIKSNDNTIEEAISNDEPVDNTSDNTQSKESIEKKSKKKEDN